MMHFDRFVGVGLCLCALLLAPPSVGLAHDIGVSSAELVEQELHHYRLRVQTSPQMSAAFPPPTLPDGFRFVGSPRGELIPGWKQFTFEGDRALVADDTLLLPWRRDGVLLTARWLDGSESQLLFKRELGAMTVSMGDLRASSGAWWVAAQRYTWLGIEHILMGIDHLLFVLGLLWIVQGGMRLVKTITAFTVAHSITLALAVLGVVRVPAAPVDACIALSIMFLGVEILHARRGRTGLTYRFPWVVSFLFGLLHGLGFAGALTGIGLPQSEIPLALLFFNVGVEVGQLLFVLAFLLVARSFRQLQIVLPPWSQPVPAYAVGTLASIWFLDRIFAMMP